MILGTFKAAFWCVRVYKYKKVLSAKWYGGDICTSSSPRSEKLSLGTAGARYSSPSLAYLRCLDHCFSSRDSSSYLFVFNIF